MHLLNERLYLTSQLQILTGRAFSLQPLEQAHKFLYECNAAGHESMGILVILFSPVCLSCFMLENIGRKRTDHNILILIYLS